MAEAPTPRAASTLALVRDAPGGLEVLLLRRAEKGDHNSGAWVFPGGLLDAGDRACHVFCNGRTDLQASALLGLAEGGLDYAVAAIRECFEEAGLLFAVDERDAFIDLDGSEGAGLAAARAPLARGERDFAGLCREFGLRLATDRLHYIDHWLTPIGRAKRFDTRFFVAVLPPAQAPAHDAIETMEHVWLKPVDALAPENSRRLMTPTRATIERLASFADSAALLAWAGKPRTVARVLPRLAVDADGPRPVLPWEPAWAEIGRLDPEGRGNVWCALRPGVLARLSTRVQRLTAQDSTAANRGDPSGAAATVVGGNSHVVVGQDGAAIVGPASRDEAHLAALLAAAGPSLRWIVVTAPDQAVAASRLKARSGALVAGRAAAGLTTDREFAGEAHDTLTLDAQTHLHLVKQGDALAALLVEEQTLFTADADAAWPASDTPVAWIAASWGFLAAAPSKETT